MDQVLAEDLRRPVPHKAVHHLACCMLIEALLSQLRRSLTAFTFAQNAQEGVTLSAYADDVTISVASQDDVHVWTKLG